jgi:MerR family transcriptional regulator/heat shock protein HspR
VTKRQDDALSFAISAGGAIDEGLERGEYIISIAAQKAEVHEQTLRHYERMGLVTPARKGTGKHSMRLYSDRDIERVIYIRQIMHDLGVNLAGVEAILRLHDRIEALQAEMDAERERLRADYEGEVRRLKQIIARLQSGATDPDQE